jgi:hypothetical protein
MALGKNILPVLLALLSAQLMQPVAAQAQVVDPLIEGAKLCTRHLQHYEREYGIPAHLLSAIASTESGRYHEGLKIKLPWPWTINAEGKGYFFNTKEEAMAAAHSLQARGVVSMDVGCMQVNLYHHPDAFASLSQAFDPENNIAYSASFLRSLYQEEGSWKKAASDYHSKTPQLGNKYIGLVYDSWFKIVDKLRSARLNVPDSSVNGLREMQTAGVNPNAASVATAPKHIRLPEQDGKNLAAYKSPHMKTITVSSYNTARNNGSRKTENGVIVVHPEIKVVKSNIEIAGSDLPASKRPPETMVMADATPVNIKPVISDSNLDSSNIANTNIAVKTIPATATSQAPEAKIIRLDNKLASRRLVNIETNKKSGPNFIFND